MRKSIDPQLKFGDVDISEIKFDQKCRDELPRILRGLQYIFITPSIRKEVFSKLQSLVAVKTSKSTGRPGMDLWKILVLGVVRLGCNWNYDKLHDMANNHSNIRKMLGHGNVDWDSPYEYNIQTLKDNVMLITPEVLEEINLIVVRAGHNLLGGKKKRNYRVVLIPL
jgi:hypothetical protein